MAELYHHGIKGQKWGVRRFQNPDGSLTPAGRKRVSKEYEKTARKVSSELSKRYNRMYIDSYNKAANYMNRGGTDKFNSDQEKKYGKDFAKRDGYEQEYMDLFGKEVAKQFNKTLNDFYNSNSDYKKSKELVDKYKMTEWDDLARSNEEKVQEVRRSVEDALKRG